MPKVWQEHGRHGSVFGHAACNPPLFLQRLTKSQREVISYLSKIEKRLAVNLQRVHHELEHARAGAARVDGELG